MPTLNRFGRLWRGDLPLGDAFWNWAVLGGLLVNLTSSLAFLLLLTRDLTIPALLVGYGLSLPYNFVATVGVWRSAARHTGDRRLADLARAATLIGMILLSLT